MLNPTPKDESSSPGNPVWFAVNVTRDVRWQVHSRLRELSVSSKLHPSNGKLFVAADDAVGIAQVRSVVKHTMGVKASLVDWLEACWDCPACQN